MGHHTLPAFDPQSPDAEILEAYEKQRATNAWAYGHDYLADTDPAAFKKFCDGYLEQNAEAERQEGVVLDNWATTPGGVAAQLCLTLKDGGLERWADRGLVEKGVRALHAERKRLDGKDQKILQAAFELLHIEFEQAFAGWERSEQTYSCASPLRNHIDKLRFAARDAGEVPDALQKLADGFEVLIGHLSNIESLERLMRTLPPDFECYQRKAAIMIDQDYGREAGPWLARDVQYLMGVIAPGDLPAEQKAAA